MTALDKLKPYLAGVPKHSLPKSPSMDAISEVDCIEKRISSGSKDIVDLFVAKSK